jgi:hypothetical protein
MDDDDTLPTPPRGSAVEKRVPRRALPRYRSGGQVAGSALLFGRKPLLWAAIGVCPLVASTRCPLTATLVTQGAGIGGYDRVVRAAALDRHLYG